MIDEEQDAKPDKKNSPAQPPKAWPKHLVHAGSHDWGGDKAPDPKDHRPQVEPWLTALVQAEHLALLIGNGLTMAVAAESGASSVDMSPVKFDCTFASEVDGATQRAARLMGRAEPNFEDQIRAARELIAGLKIIAGGIEAPNAAGPTGSDEGQSYSGPQMAAIASSWEEALDNSMRRLLKSILETERGIHAQLTAVSEDGDRVRRLLGGFLLAFASRTATRERLQIFTTNYDRLIEYGCDLLGVRTIDRFQGTLAPVFRSSRLGIDIHYNPPGMRGEPRYLEGVVRFTKLHGSVDWRREDGPSGGPEVQRYGIPFGAPNEHPGFPKRLLDSLLIYPNPAKDFETLEYPYAELFRDFAAAVCQPNVVLATYGYGFGDDHVNRVIRDILTIPSTHLVIMSYGTAGGRVQEFYDTAARQQQITLLIGEHFGHLPILVENYLPKPAIDRVTWRMVDLLNKRARPDPISDDKKAHKSGDGKDK